jgi:hypothetical protein
MIRTKLNMLRSVLHVGQLSTGLVLGMLLGYALFQWYQSVEKADIDGLTRSVGAMPADGVDLTFDSKFPDSMKTINFARAHMPKATRGQR